MASKTLLEYLTTQYFAQAAPSPDVVTFVAWAERELRANAPVGTGFADDSGAITVRLQSGDQFALSQQPLVDSGNVLPSVPITGQPDRKRGNVTAATDIPITGG